MNMYYKNIIIVFLIYVTYVGKILSAYPPNYEEALKLFQEKKYEESLNKIREVFDNYKNSLEFRLLAASNYIELKDYNNALAHLKYALVDHPDSVEVYILMSEVDLKINQISNSLNILYKAYEQFKQDKIKTHLIRYQIARIFYFTKKFEKSRQQLEILIAENPYNYNALFLDGIIYLQEKNYELSEFRLKSITTLKKVDPETLKKVYNNLGFIQEIYALNQEKPDIYRNNARNYYKKSLEIDPHYVYAINNLNRL